MKNRLTDLSGIAFLLVAVSAIGGCGSPLTIFAGKPPGAKATAPVSEIPSPPSMAYASASTDPFAATSVGLGIAPPTVPADPNADPFQAPASVGSEGPHRPIAVSPLSSDPAALSSLSAAAGPLAANAPAARFVLLILTPPSADTAAIDRTRADAQAAADAAIKVLGLSGVAADRIAVSAATSPGLVQGELRLYLR